jgi:hypothetical protein
MYCWIQYNIVGLTLMAIISLQPEKDYRHELIDIDLRNRKVSAGIEFPEAPWSLG